MTVGSFIELYPFAACIDADTRFVDLLERVRTESNQFLRYAQPGAGHPNLQSGFNMVLNYITASFGSFANLPVTCDWVHCDHGDAAHHLRLQVHDFDGAGELVLHFDVNEEVFDERLQPIAIEQFLNLLERMAEAPEGLVLDTSLQNIASGVPWQAPKGTVIDAILHQAGATPDAIAVRSPDISFSYADLVAKSAAVAAGLKALGVARGDHVGICLARRPEAVAALVGVLRAGAAYLPLEIDHPPARLQYMLSDAEAALCIVSKESPVLAVIPTAHVEDLLKANGIPGGNDPSTSDLAYTIYTSGSTGQPKGVEIEHASLLNYTSWAKFQYADEGACSFPWFTPLSFDLTVTSIFVPLLSGGEIAVYPREDNGGDLALLDVIDDDRVDVVKLTPSHLALLQDRKFQDSRIRAMVLGGEDLRRNVASASGGGLRRRADNLQRIWPHRGDCGLYDPPFRSNDGYRNLSPNWASGGWRPSSGARRRTPSRS